MAIFIALLCVLGIGLVVVLWYDDAAHSNTE